MTLDFQILRRDFPVLGRPVHGKKLVYLDSAATSQKPRTVIEAVRRYYEEENANIHRGVHFLSERATELYEAARQKAQRFINARAPHEIIFTRGTTEAINLVAASFARPRLKAGDEIVLTQMEHHSNIVPWQLAAEAVGAKLRIVPINDRGELLLDEYEKLLNEKTRLVAVVHVSNTLGTINPVKEMIATAHRREIPVLIDGAQAVPHLKVDVQELDCDFYAFSGHKMCGPTGIGVLYGKEQHLSVMPPYQGGGDMIRTVRFEKTTYNDLPFKFEAGTPHIAGAIGLGAAIDYLSGIGLDSIATYENDLVRYGTEALSQVPGLKIIGATARKAGVISFVMEGVHPHDIGTILDREGIAIRTGHHCTMPLMERLGLPATARCSIAFYNSREDLDALILGLKKVRGLFR